MSLHDPAVKVEQVDFILVNFIREITTYILRV